ncbi:MAG TPA: AI-2E family transporter [Candidatus Paceibacterota bacterium]|nr:AI-2E family transporter [Verrucomicrobiota bacterium]HSA12749.1 AI-2E family transporter [Candidatus Paceibacterota bacterium]
MITVEGLKPSVGKPARVSYLVILATFVLVGWFHMATPLLAALFSYLALTKLHFLKRGGKWLAVVLFLILLSAATYVLGHFTAQTIRALPEIADKAIPSVIEWARQYQVELPFTDYDSLKELGLDTVRNQSQYLGGIAKFARGATTQFLFLAMGCAIAIGLFLNPRLEIDREKHLIRNNFYSLCCDHIAVRFTTFYRSFATVMGAQILISAVNTVFTGIFALAVQLPYAVVVIGVTFLCGLLPIVGNLISNTIIVAIGFTVSPQIALIALTFLVLIHKLEYFLNSKIIGHRIRNPFWLTLLALIVGERLMGVPGMILAPIVLNYLKREASIVEVGDQEAPRPAPSS